jgi:hypothetical protein
VNKEGHIITSLIALVMWFCLILVYVLREFGWMDVMITSLLSSVTYMIGVCLPDLDHPMVNRRIFLMRWLGKVSKHRGHWHSIGAALIYTLAIGVITLFVFVYWYVITIAAFVGYFSHLVEDDLNSLYKRKKIGKRRGLKLW